MRLRARGAAESRRQSRARGRRRAGGAPRWNGTAKRSADSTSIVPARDSLSEGRRHLDLVLDQVGPNPLASVVPLSVCLGVLSVSAVSRISAPSPPLRALPLANLPCRA